MTSILITGGAGFIGSHTALVLLEAGHNLVVLDNFTNSSPESLRRVVNPAGASPVCATSTQWEPTRAATSGKIPAASPTICSPS